MSSLATRRPSFLVLSQKVKRGNNKKKNQWVVRYVERLLASRQIQVVRLRVKSDSGVGKHVTTLPINAVHKHFTKISLYSDGRSDEDEKWQEK